MPIAVQVPIRIRVDVHALADPSGKALSETFAPALLRALENSRAVVLEDRGGYQTVQLALPSFTWLGEGLSAVSEERRVAIERTIGQWIEQLAQGAGLFDFVQDQESAPLPLSETPRESFDPLRHDETFDLYSVPSYDRGKKTSVRVKAKKRRSPPKGRKEYGWIAIDRRGRENEPLDRGNPIDEAVFLRMIDPAIEHWGNRPLGTLWGYIWYQTNKRYGYYFEDYGSLDKPIIRSHLLPNLIESRWDGEQWVDDESQIPIGIATVRVLTTASSVQQLRENAMALWASEIRDDLTADAEKKRILISKKTIEDAVAAEVVRRTEEWEKQLEKNPIAILELRVGGHVTSLAVPASFAWEGTAELLPVTRLEVVQDTPKKKKGKGPQLATDSGNGAAPGTGKKTGQGAGAGQKEGTGTGQEEYRGPVIVFDTPQATSPGGLAYPQVPLDLAALDYLAALERLLHRDYECESYEGEPAVSELGEQGELLKSLITEIAGRLQIPPCDYAAQFLLMATQTITVRAHDIGEFAAQSRAGEMGFTRAATNGKGNLRTIEFRPTASPAIQYLRFLARVFPLITGLSRAVDDVYKTRFNDFDDDRPYSFNRWWIDLHADLNGELQDAVGRIFMASCRVLMLQLLRSSAVEIQKRINVLPQYAPIFEKLVLTQLMEIEELKELKRRLSEKIKSPSIGQQIAGKVLVSWRDAHHGLGTLLTPTPSFLPEGAGEFVQRGSSYAIRDEKGFEWTLQQLDESIEIRQNTAVAIDPLVQQITDMPYLKMLVDQNPMAIRTELARLLQEMAESNREITDDVCDKFVEAFRMGKIQDDQPGGTFGWGYELSGIHLQAHELIGEFFDGDHNYQSGVYWLFRHEESRRDSIAFITFTGITLLSILCPPLGEIVGVAVSIYDYHEAQEKKALYRALINPTEIISWAEVEMELFAAELGIALSFIPYVSRTLKLGTSGVKTLVKEGVRDSARATLQAGREALTLEGAAAIVGTLKDRFTKDMAEALKHGLIVAFTEEVIKNEIMDVIISKVVFDPIVEAIYREYGLEPEPSTGED
jgi:hypothetical protein